MFIVIFKGSMGVVYFDQLSGASAPESWSNYFFSAVLTFFVEFKSFSLISGLKSLKNVFFNILIQKD